MEEYERISDAASALLLCLIKIYWGGRALDE